ncbi:MAG TPA: 3-hydroxyacyl-CoA dehydrogenase NAD-binding domain-containing protein [Polyangiaceae bacterium]|jgi:3-hydroxybutyryl-CoA dehydrogenase|nr:3-hydroxyacyl-CoA dehydrogenase NAD-binding domain-containing protein [Polyangiaceae bacterium]
MRLSDHAVVGVVGAGQMGAGIAQVLAQFGYTVLLADVSIERAQAGKSGIERALTRLVDKGKLEAALRDSALARITPSNAPAAYPRCDLVIEAATENRELKLEIFKDADALCKPHVILASNTSSISLTALAGHTNRPERVIGMHFMNPVPLMKLVEIVRGLQTSDETVATIRALGERLNRQLVYSQDRPGFLINRILIPFLNEACFALEEGTGSAEDIDRGARLGLNHPMGPFELADLIGLDTVLSIAQVLEREFGDSKYRAPVLLKNLVAAGWLGKKTGRGFYSYDEQGAKVARAT